MWAPWLPIDEVGAGAGFREPGQNGHRFLCQYRLSSQWPRRSRERTQYDPIIRIESPARRAQQVELTSLEHACWWHNQRRRCEVGKRRPIEHSHTVLASKSSC